MDEPNDDLRQLFTERVWPVFCAECYPLQDPPRKTGKTIKRFRDWFLANREREDVREIFNNAFVECIADYSLQEGIEAGELATVQKVGLGGKLETWFCPREPEVQP